MTRWEQVQQDAKVLGLNVARYSPGDGYYRYRFSPFATDFHAMPFGHQVRGIKRAEEYIRQYRQE